MLLISNMFSFTSSYIYFNDISCYSVAYVVGTHWKEAIPICTNNIFDIKKCFTIKLLSQTYQQLIFFHFQSTNHVGMDEFLCSLVYMYTYSLDDNFSQFHVIDSLS